MGNYQMTPEDLLAVIHGDGGHHTSEVGLAQSISDAVSKIHAMRRHQNELCCVYEMRLTKWSYEKAPRACERFSVLYFFAAIPHCPQQGSKIDGLPGVVLATVSACVWNHKAHALFVRLQDEEYESLEEFTATGRMLVERGWQEITAATKALTQLEGRFGGN